MNNNYHNPDGLTKEDIPNGRRLITEQELKKRQELTTKNPEKHYDPEIHRWDDVRKQWLIGRHGFAGDCYFFTYCVPNDWQA